MFYLSLHFLMKGKGEKFCSEAAFSSRIMYLGRIMYLCQITLHPLKIREEKVKRFICRSFFLLFFFFEGEREKCQEYLIHDFIFVRKCDFRSPHFLKTNNNLEVFIFLANVGKNFHPNYLFLFFNSSF